MENAVPTSKQIRYCCVCHRRSTDEANNRTVYHRFPQNHARSNEWAKIIGREDILQKPVAARLSYFVCNRHFPAFMYPLQIMSSRLKRTAVPVLSLKVRLQTKSRFQRLKTRDENQIALRINDRVVNEILVGEEDEDDDVEEIILPTPVDNCEEEGDHTYALSPFLLAYHAYANLQQATIPPPPIQKTNPPPNRPNTPPIAPALETDQTQKVPLIANLKKQLKNNLEKPSAEDAEPVKNHMALHVATYSGCLDDVQSVVRNGADVNRVDCYGNTPLLVAIRLGLVNIVDFLLKCGASTTVTDCLSMSALSWAIRENNERIVELLLDKRLNSNVPCPNSVLAFVVKCGAKRIFDLLLENDDVDVNYEDAGKTVLGWAAMHGKLDMAKALINRGADVNLTGSGGNTPLATAIEHKHSQLVEYLTEITDVCVVGPAGRTPLAWAVDTQDLGLMKRLLQHGAQPLISSVLLDAIRTKNLQVVKFLIDNGAQVSQCNRPLMKALDCGSIEIATYLLQQGVSVYDDFEEGYTPLLWAVQNQNVELLESILEHGGRGLVNSVFMEAIKSGNLDTVKVLKENGALVKYGKHRIMTPLKKALEIGSVAIVRYLIENGAPIRDCEAQHVQKFVNNKHWAMLKVLEEYGVEIEGGGESPLSDSMSDD